MFNPEQLTETEALQQLLTTTFTTVHQFTLHSCMLQDWGLEPLHERVTAAASQQLALAGELVERLLQLGMTPKVDQLGRFRLGTTLYDLLLGDLYLAHEQVEHVEVLQAACSTSDADALAQADAWMVIVEAHHTWALHEWDRFDVHGEDEYIARLLSG